MTRSDLMLRVKVWSVFALILSLLGAAAVAKTSHGRQFFLNQESSSERDAPKTSTPSATPATTTTPDAAPSADPAAADAHGEPATPSPTEPPATLPDVLPEVSLPVVEAPGGCSGVDAAAAATRPARALAARTGDAGSRSDDLPRLLFSRTPFDGWTFDLQHEIGEFEAGYRRNLQETPEMVQAHGYAAGFERRWVSGGENPMSSSEVRIDVMEFGSMADALGYDDESATSRGICDYVTKTFVIPTVAGATGRLIMGAEAPVSEQVSFVRGSRRYVAVLNHAHFNGYAGIAKLAQLLDETAR